MIGSRNRATSPSSKSKSVWVTVSRSSHRARDLWPTYINAQHKNISSFKATPPTIRGKTLHLAQTHSLAFDSFWKMDHRVWQINPCEQTPTVPTPPPPRVGENWLWRLTILHEWLEMSKQWGNSTLPILAFYWYHCFVSLLRANATPFIFCWEAQCFLLQGFPGAAKKKLWDVSMCNWIFFFPPVGFYAHLTNNYTHLPSPASEVIFLFLW